MTASSSFPLLLLLFSRCRQTFRPVEGGGENSNAVLFCAKSQLVSVVGMKGENLKESDGRTREKSLRKEPHQRTMAKKKETERLENLRSWGKRSLNRAVVQDSRTFPVTFSSPLSSSIRLKQLATRKRREG